MGGMGRPIQPKKLVRHAATNKSATVKPAVPVAHLGELKRVCPKCGHIWMARSNPFVPLKCPECKTIINK